MTLEDVRSSLDINPNMSTEIKDMFFWLAGVFNKKYPEISLDNLCKYLKTLEFKKSNKFVDKKIYRYNEQANLIEVNLDIINDGYDMRNIMMCALLNIITNNGQMTGFNKANCYRALNSGYTEVLANNLVGYEGEKPYLEHETITANQIAYLVSPDVIFKAYFTNDIDYLIDEMFKKGFDDNESDKQI